VMVRLNLPPVVGMPPRVAVPLPLSVNVTPAGKAPDSEMAGTGYPVVFTVKELSTSEPEARFFEIPGDYKIVNHLNEQN